MNLIGGAVSHVRGTGCKLDHFLYLCDANFKKSLNVLSGFSALMFLCF